VQQRVTLDRFAGVETTGFAKAFAAWRSAEQALHDRTARMAELRREVDLLTHGIAEIAHAAPQAGEDLELAAVAGRLSHADALRLAARTAHDTLLGNADIPMADAADVSGLLATAGRALGQQSGADPLLDALAARVDELATLSAELGSEFGSYADHLDADPARLDQVQARRAVLSGLVRKYAPSPDGDLGGVLRWAVESRTRLTEIDISDEAIAALRARRDEAASRVAQLAAALTTARRASAVTLAEAVTAELAGLAMPDARLTIQVRPRPAVDGAPSLLLDGAAVGVGAEGADEVEFLLRPHAEAPALPISRGASGGELSRVMLALELCLAGTDPVPTMVFDEVDAGVGGRAAVEVGRRLARLARHRQVIVVTHLAQVAAFADRHVVVDKPGAGERSVTASDVRCVTDTERVAELARMLAGSDSETAREHAAELLADAAEARARETPVRRRNGRNVVK
jgi:DNA repair protein RecN (Recombination protein N)